MINISIDVESDGPIQGTHSMISFGAVVIDNKLDKTFFGQLAPIGSEYVPDALKVSGYTRKQTESFPDAETTMKEFERWLQEINPKGERISFYSDNNGYDFAWINWYSHVFLGYNPFGHSSNNIGSIFKGYKKSMKARFKYLRKTKHTHNPVDDAKGNAEAVLAMSKMGIWGLS